MYKSIVVVIIMSILSCQSPQGNQIPEFEYKSPDGNVVSEEDLRGKATVICVWATWCGDCIREIPELNALAEKYKGNNKVSFLAFSDEDGATVRKSLNKFPFNFTHIVDSKAYSDKLKTGLVKHFPQVLVVDDDLNIVFEVTENKQKIFITLDNHIQDIIK